MTTILSAEIRSSADHVEELSGSSLIRGSNASTADTGRSSLVAIATVNNLPRQGMTR